LAGHKCFRMNFCDADASATMRFAAAV